MAKKEMVQEPVIQQEQKESLDIPYNQRTRQSYIDNGFTAEIPDNLDMREKKFLSRCDTSGKFPVIRKLTRMIRVKWRDPNLSPPQEKDYLVYYEDWYGQDWLGRRIPVVADHQEGLYLEQEKEINIEYGDKGPIRRGVKRSGEHKAYYIEFDKETVDKIIANSPETYKPDIKFTVVFEGTQRDDRFSYEQFFKSWDELSKLSNRKGGPRFGNQYLPTEDTLKAGVT